MSKVQTLLKKLNSEYATLHSSYEDLFWVSYMGDHSVDKELGKAMAARDAFAANEEYYQQVLDLKKGATKTEKQQLAAWEKYFSKYQVPAELKNLKKQIGELETQIQKKRAGLKEGYIDPYTKKFVAASHHKMRTMMRNHPDEKVRKACFDGDEKQATALLAEYIELVQLRNQYARSLGYDDFYDFKTNIEEGMSSSEVFAIFDKIYEKTKYAFADVRKLEKKMPGLRKPWNFSYMMTGDFSKEEDPYFPFNKALERWGKSFTALGIDYAGGKLQLDLLDRQGKYNNGFCHWPRLVQFKNGKRLPGASNFTCNVVYGQVGSAYEGYATLFHEGGHAAHYLNVEESQIVMHIEYPPSSTAWAETQSMFLDTLFSSIEWRTRYAKNESGESYPFDLFERKARKTHLLWPLDMMGIMFVMNFERQIYSAPKLTPEKVVSIAKKIYRKYSDKSEDSLSVLTVPHIYAWESSCSYHGYGLAELSLAQWRHYFYKKYGYLVDNPNVGKEMKNVWKYGAAKTYAELVQLATGKKLSPQAYIDDITRGLDATLKLARARIKKMQSVAEFNGKVNLKADIRMIHGKKLVADSRKGFEPMAEKYSRWLAGQKQA